MRTGRRIALALGLVSGLARAADHPPLPALALITADDVRIRTTPSAKGRYAGVLYRNMTVTALEESRRQDTVGETTAPWIRVHADDGDGWVFGGFLDFGMTDAADTYDSDGSLDWFFARFGEASDAISPSLLSGTPMSTAEYRRLMTAAQDTDGWPGQLAAGALRETAYARLAAQPDDPGLAYLKRKLYSARFVTALLDRGDLWLLDVLPRSWWTRDRTLVIALACGQVDGLGARLCELNLLRPADLGPDDAVRLINSARASRGSAFEAAHCAGWPAVVAHRSDPAWRNVVAHTEEPDLVYEFLAAGQRWVAPLLPKGWWTPQRLLAIARDPALPQGAPELALTTGLVRPSEFTSRDLGTVLELAATPTGRGAADLLRHVLYEPVAKGLAGPDVMARQEVLRSEALVGRLVRSRELWIVDMLGPDWWTARRVRSLMLDPDTPADLPEKLVEAGRIDMFRLSASDYLDLIAAVESDASPHAALAYLLVTTYPYFAEAKASPRYAAVRRRLHARSLTNLLVHRGEFRILQHLPPAALGRADVEPWLGSVSPFGLFYALPDRLKDDARLAVAIFRRGGEDSDSIFCGMSATLHADRTVALAAVRAYPHALRCVSESLRDDKGLVLRAIQGSACAFNFASERLRSDPDVRAAARLAEGADGPDCGEE